MHPEVFVVVKEGGKIPSQTDKEINEIKREINEIKGWVYPWLDPNPPNPAHGCGASG